MSKDVRIRKGVNIKLKGTAEKLYANPVTTSEIVLKPDDFPTTIPKLSVKVGDKVQAGSPLFYDKNNDAIKFTSPVSGEVTEIKRGEKRKILEIRVKADGTNSFASFKQGDPASMSREEIKENMLNSGVWPFVRQRPYEVIANPADAPKAIHVTAMDSSPLAPDYDFVVHGENEVFQTGLNALAKLTDGKVHLNVNANANADAAFTSAKSVQVNKVSGPHPAGNVGVQIHHIDPVNKGEVVWTLRALDVLTIGRLFKEGKFDASRVVALAGSKVKAPKYYRTILGANISEIVKDNIEEGESRYISGNVLSGTKIDADGHIGFYDYQLSVIPEGGNNQFFGWIAPGFSKFSLSRSFFSWIMPGKTYDLNTNMNGEERAFVVTGEYEKVFPMNIYPVHLVKAMVIKDIDLMESLGVYEVAPEDFALCEYACTSKIDTQKIVREALDLVKQECS